MPLFQCVPNFSEGRRVEVIAALAAAVRGVSGVRLIDCSADVDHNRCVLTFLGDAEPIRAAALAACRIAVGHIDLRTHQGVHPRTGAIDVLPVVPLRNAGRAEAVTLAHRIGADLAAELALPVRYYAWAARPGHNGRLPDLRRDYAHFAASQADALTPDAGPIAAHPTAGIAFVGARGPLVAYNIDLDTQDSDLARAIARQIRQERDRLPQLRGVRALGLFLASRGRAQVSMNLTRPDASPLPAVFAYVRNAAIRLGADAVESEIIGVIPQAALGGLGPEAILWHAYRPIQILDNWQGE